MSLEEKLNQKERNGDPKAVAAKILAEKLEEQAIEKASDKIATGCATVLVHGSKYLGIAIDLSAGFYVGYNDGAGNTLDPALKTILLTTPAVMSGVKETVLIGGVKYAGIYGIEEQKDKFKQRLEKKLNRTLIDSEINDYHNKFKQISVSYLAAKSTLEAVVGIGIGYALGYLVAKLS